ncbi:hypothetical protein PNP59_03100 [Halobacterium salinarum]|uniref:hypothetical protein n=1 Tax=Halobacterium salinarum TaxID=2242 RepID=UPI00255397C2|nr:hypothetical protein [Halobacterium salinarum]MDL0129925.1 hypothetical protein [Halobacterium salinarum]
MPPALTRATLRRAFAATVALDTDPPSGPDARNGLKLAARSGRVGARCWMGGRLGRALARAREGAREGASESAQTSLSVVVVEEIRDVGASRCRARERLQEY